MKLSTYHQILGCLVEAGRSDLAKVMAAKSHHGQFRWKRINPETKKLEYRWVGPDKKPGGPGWKRAPAGLNRSGGGSRGFRKS